MGVLLEDLKAELASITETTAEFEVNGRKVTLVAKPLTPADMTEITKRHRDFVSNPNMEGMIDLLIRKARIDGQSTKAFDAADKPFLMKLPTTKIGDLFTTLFGEQLEKDADEEIEAHKGN